MFIKILNLFRFFDKKLRIKLIYTQILMLISSTFEILSIFSIGPLIQILNDPNIIYNNEESKLSTDIILIDMITGDIKLEMVNKSEKVRLVANNESIN